MSLSKNKQRNRTVKIVKDFCKVLKLKLIETIEQMEVKLLEKAENVDNLKDSLLKEYTKLSKRKELKTIIFDSKASLTEKSESTKAIVTAV